MTDGKKILYIDDDINMLNSGEDILVNAGYSVSLAKSGDQGLKLLSRNAADYDLILLDVDMPVMDGYETFEKIREIKGCEQIPIIFLTGMDAPDFEIRGLTMGAADYITKPFIREVFLARIGSRLRSTGTETAEESGQTEKCRELEKILTPVEISVVRLVAEGCTNKEIADKSNYSYAYIKKMISGILDKLELKNRAEIRHLLKR
ncbi:MAG: response regulator [Lachnospiraceae bacterium]|nr:response regulator [Lachnospiraceae bacterium]